MDIKKFDIAEYFPIIALTAVIIGSLFVGFVVGEVVSKASALNDRQALVESYDQLVASKDQLIAILSTANAQATGAVVAQSTEAIKTVTTQADAVQKQTQNELQRAEQRERSKRAAEQRKLREMK